MNIAVVIPAHNAEETVARAIESAARQRRSPQEIILVADNCQDATATVARRAGAAVFEVALGSPAAARNHALSRIGDASDWIAFLDADDWWAPTWLDAVAAAAERVPDATLVAGGAIDVYTDGQQIRRRSLPADLETDPFSRLLQSAVITTSAVVVKRQALPTTGPFDERIRSCGEDHDLWLRLSVSGKFALAQGSHVFYRHSDDGEMARFDRFSLMREQNLESLERAVQQRPVSASLHARARASIFRMSAERFLAAGAVASARHELRRALALQPGDWRCWAMAVLSLLRQEERTVLLTWRREARKRLARVPAWSGSP